MSGKLDQSLDEILSSRRHSARRGGRGANRNTNTSRRTVAPPVGGIKKNHATRNARGAGRQVVPSGPADGAGASKIIVSNLPADVSEVQIKEYFGKSVGPVKRAIITYGPNGVSRGVATIIFTRPSSANEALLKLNGLLVDKRPMKIEVVLDAARAPPSIPAKGLSERIAHPKGNPKGNPKPATSAKSSIKGTTIREGGRGRGVRRGRNAGRAKPKTADELDAEMSDYFGATGTNGTTGTDGAFVNGTNQPIANGEADLGMDEISDQMFLLHEATLI